MDLMTMVHSYIHCLCVNIIKKLCASASVSAIQKTLEWRILFHYLDKEQHITTIHFFLIRSKQKKKKTTRIWKLLISENSWANPHNNLLSTSSFWLFLNSKFNYFTTFCAHFFCVAILVPWTYYGNGEPYTTQSVHFSSTTLIFSLWFFNTWYWIFWQCSNIIELLIEITFEKVSSYIACNLRWMKKNTTHTEGE